MRSTVSDRLDAVPLRNLTAKLREGETVRHNLTPRGAIVEQAMKNAGLEPKQMADDMGISPSFLQRGFKDQEHISWQRLQAVKSPKFHREFLALQAAELEGVETETTIRIPRRA